MQRSEPAGVPEISVSIGTITVVVEEPAQQAVKPQPAARSQRQSAPASDWTRLRRLYIR